MKYSKLFIFIGVIITGLIILFISMLLITDNSNPCHGGRDTVEEFGKFCRYAILSSSNKNVLFDRNNQFTIDSDIIDFIEKEPYVYSVGINGYTKLDYYNNIYIQKKDLDKFENIDKDNFILLRKRIKKKYDIKLYTINNNKYLLNVELIDNKTNEVKNFQFNYAKTDNYVKWINNNLVEINGSKLIIYGNREY